MATQTVPQGQVMAPDAVEEEALVANGAISAIEEADRSHQVATAKRFPRSITRFRQELSEIARADQRVAMEMMYSLPRAGQQLVGPSIRFAEAVISCWGNSRAGVEVIDVNKREEYVQAEGRFYDCEKNVGFAIRIRRRNVTRTKNDDSYQVTGAAASSLALRNAILRGVPKALWADIFEQAKQTAAGEAQSIAQTRAELLKLFNALGITSTQIFNALQVAGAADIGANEIVALKAWHRQLTSKESTIEDIFGSPLDEEIERTMAALGWNETQKRLSRNNFAGRREDHLAYVKAEAAKAGIAVESPSQAAAKPAQQQQPNPTPQTQPTKQEGPEQAVAAPAQETAPPQQKPQTQAAPRRRAKDNW